MTGRRFAPLGVQPFGSLLASYTVNELGDSVGVVALTILVYDRTKAIAPTAAFFMVARFLPALLAPVLTARVDQLSLRRTLPAIYLVEAVLFGALALLAHGRFLLAVVLALALVDGTLAITGRGLTRGAVAAVLQPVGLLRAGNGLMNVGFAVASVGGAALAGLLVATFGLAIALLADALSFLVIAVVLAASSHLPHVEVQREPFRERFRAGVHYARSHTTVRALLVGQAAALVLFTLIIPIEVFYARESLGTTSAGYGVLLASWGAGIVIGSLVYLQLRRAPSYWLVIGSTLAVGVAYLGLASAGSLVAACAISIVGGSGNGIQWVAVVTSVQEETAADYQSRITGMLESIGAAVPGVGYLLGAGLVAVSSPRTAYAVAGGGLIVLTGIALLAVLSRTGPAPLRPPPRPGAPSGGA